MRLTVLGASGTYPTPGHPCSGYLVSSGGTTVLLDIGPGVFSALLDAGVMPDAIVVTHRHADHCAGLFSLLNYLRFDRPDLAPIPVLAPTGVADMVGAFLGHGRDGAFFQMFDHDVVAAGDERTVGALRLTFGLAAHPVPAVCVRVDDGADTVTYSGDTGPGGDLPALAAGAGTLLCEATLQGEPGEGRFTGHLFAAEGGALAAAAGVTRLILTHLAPRLDPAVSVAEAGRAFDGEIMTARPGLEVEL